VVIPAYQNVATIAATVSSVLAQTFRDFELVVTDHDSTDGTLEALRDFDDPRLILLTTPAGGGAERNWNEALGAATAPYLKLVCGDDLLYPDCLAEQVKALDGHPTAVLVAARRDVVDPSGRPLLSARGLGPLNGLVAGDVAIRTLARAGTNLLGEPACVLLRTEVVRTAGGWRAADPYFIDEDLYLRVLRHGDLVALQRPLAAFRLSLTQWSARLIREQAAQARRFHRRMADEMPDVVSPADARRGALLGTAAAYQRRIAYLLWKRRLREAGPAPVASPRAANGKVGPTK
jgi:glycosyltransferase involved in cell wall biosynthesis